MPNNPTWEETTDAAPTWDETSDVATPDTDNAINAEKARNTLRDYSAGNIDLDEDHLHNAYTVATEGKSAAHRAGDWMLRALEVGANPIEQAQLATKFAGETISTLDKAGHELARPVTDLISGKSVGEAAKDYLKTPANVTAGLAQGTAQIPEMAAGVVNEVGDLAGQAMGVDTTKSDVGYYKFLHDVNHAVEKGGEAIGAEKDSGMKEIAATAPFMALPLGTAEAVSPFAAKIADTVVEKGTQAAGKVISGAAKTAETVGPAALAAAEMKGGHYLGAIATLLAGYGGQGIPFFNKVKKFIIDKGIGAIDDLGKTLSRTEHGQTVMEKAQADIIEDANKVHARINAETAKLKPEQLDRVNSGNYAPDHPILSKEEKAILGDKELLRGLEDKAARAGKWVDYNQIVSDAAKGGIQGLINTGAAATTGEAITSSTAPPEDVEAQKAGAGMGVGFAAPFILKLNKSGVLKMNTDEMVKSGKAEVDQDSIAHIPQEQQDHVNAVAGFLKPQGWKVVVQNPSEFMQGPQNTPQAGHADPATKTIFLNSEKLGSGVGYHEMTHALGEALGWENSPLGDQIKQGLQSTDPKDQAIVQSFLDKYRDAMKLTNPGFESLPIKAQVSETMAELGRDILHTTYGGLAEFYRGKSGGKIIADMFRRAKDEPTAPLPTGYLNAPEIGGTRKGLEEKLYEAGKQAEQGKPAPSLDQATVAPPAVNPLTQHFDTIVRGLRSMGSSAADAKAAATKVIDEGATVSPNATAEDLMKRALTGRWPTPSKQFMPAEAPQTPEFKKWSEDAPVVLDSAPRGQRSWRIEPTANDYFKVTPLDEAGESLGTVFTWNRARLANEIGQEGMSKIRSRDFKSGDIYVEPPGHEFKTGEPVVVGAYHGSPSGKFTVFDPSKSGSYTGASSAREAFFFAGNPDTAQAYSEGTNLNDQSSPYMHEVYVKMKNPFVHDFKGSHYREESYYNLIKKAKSEGHDGVIFTNTFDGADKPDNIFAVFDNKSIKSTDNRGHFDPNNPDIRFMPSEAPDAINTDDKGRPKAAVKLPDGKIFTDVWHPGAWAQATEHYSAEQLGKWIREFGDNYAQRGFITNDGNFVDPYQADELALKNKQITQNDVDRRDAQRQRAQEPQRGLESLHFAETQRAKTKPSFASHFMPAEEPYRNKYASSHQVNIGLNTNDGKGITPEQAVAALKSAGVDVLKTDIHQSDTEPTLVASLDRPLTPEEGDRVSRELKQEAIAQYSSGKGDLYGPEADKWKPFNPDYFLTHEGVPLRSTRTGSSGLWDATFVSGEGRELRKDLSDEFGANEDKHFFEQKPEVQQKIKDYFTGLGQAHFMPSDPKELKTYQEAIGQKFPEALLPQAVTNKKGEITQDPKGGAKPQKIKYRLDKTLMAQDKSREEQVEAYRGRLVDYFNEVKDDPDVKAGIGWYEDARTLLKSLFGDNHKLFAQLLAATSKNESAGQNMKYAVDTYNRWINGDFDDVIKKFEDAHQRFQNGTLKDGKTKVEGPGEFDAYLAKHNIQMLQASGKKIGLHSRAALYALTGNFEQYINGLKLNQFSKNLSGDSVKATIDMWAARTLHRLGNEGNTERWRILPVNESGIDEIDFKLGHDAFNTAAEELGMNPDDLQAALWFAEKKLYDANGWSPLDYGDFREPLRKLEYKPESNTYEFPEGYKVNAKRKGLVKDLSDAELSHVE